MTTKNKERLQFDFSTEALKRLDDIKTKTDASTRAETVRKALRLYEWFVSEMDPDYTVKIYDKSNKLPTAFTDEHSVEEVLPWSPLQIIQLQDGSPVDRAAEYYPQDNITASAVADYFLALANECEEPITNMKLNILVYYAQAWHLALFNRPLFADEIEAQVHGPILRTVYDTYRQFRWTPIITNDLNLEELRRAV